MKCVSTKLLFLAYVLLCSRAVSTKSVSPRLFVVPSTPQCRNHKLGTKSMTWLTDDQIQTSMRGWLSTFSNLCLLVCFGFWVYGGKKKNIFPTLISVCFRTSGAFPACRHLIRRIIQLHYLSVCKFKYIVTVLFVYSRQILSEWLPTMC